jgi:hypothetical protein
MPLRQRRDTIGAEERPHRAPPSSGTTLSTRPRHATDLSQPCRLHLPSEPPHPAANPSHQHHHAVMRQGRGLRATRTAAPPPSHHVLLLHATPTLPSGPSPHAPPAAPRPPAATFTSDPSAATGPPPRAIVLPHVADRPHTCCSLRHLAALACHGATTRRSCRFATRTAPVPAWSPATAILAARVRLCASRALRRRQWVGGEEGASGGGS